MGVADAGFAYMTDAMFYGQSKLKFVQIANIDVPSTIRHRRIEEFNTHRTSHEISELLDLQ